MTLEDHCFNGFPCQRSLLTPTSLDPAVDPIRYCGHLQDIFTPVSQLVITLSARVDHWRNYDGHNLETTVATGLPTANNRASIQERSDTVVSPRAAALYHLSDRVSVWGAANSGFRAPTLTELYRQFSVGAVTTRPNDQLGPERLVGGEAGLNVAPARNVSARVTWFDNRVTDPEPHSSTPILRGMNLKTIVMIRLTDSNINAANKEADEGPLINARVTYASSTPAMWKQTSKKMISKNLDWCRA